MRNVRSCVFLCFCATVSIIRVSVAASASGNSEPFAIDARNHLSRRLAPSDTINFSAFWLNSSEIEDLSVRVEQVTGYLSDNPVTNTLVFSEEDAEGFYNWVSTPNLSETYRLLHWFESDGERVGDPLVCDVVTVVPGKSILDCEVDSNESSFLDIVASNGVAPLAYSAIWQTGYRSILELTRVFDDPLNSVTTRLLDGEPGGEGTFQLAIDQLRSADYELRHVTLDSSDQVVGDDYVVYFQIDRPKGTILCVQ